jgi:hypothetical protein
MVEGENVGLSDENPAWLVYFCGVGTRANLLRGRLAKGPADGLQLGWKAAHRRDSAGSPPDEVQVEFGIILSAEVGAVLAAASATVNYKVNMT